jgi:hypothetical protein
VDQIAETRSNLAAPIASCVPPLQVHRASSWTFVTTGAAVMTTTAAAVVRTTPFGICGPFVYQNNLFTKTGSGQAEK